MDPKRRVEECVASVLADGNYKENVPTDWNPESKLKSKRKRVVPTGKLFLFFAYSLVQVSSISTTPNLL